MSFSGRVRRGAFESAYHGRPVIGWLTSREWLVNRLHRGDRIWLFIGGDACGDEKAPCRGCLAQLLVVDKWGDYAKHRPGVRGSPRFHIHGDVKRCVLVKRPALVDSILRKPEIDAEQHIGVARQTPFELDGGQVAEFLALLSKEYPEVHKAAT